MQEITISQEDGWVTIAPDSVRIQRLHSKTILYQHSATKPSMDDMSGFRIIDENPVDAYGVEPCHIRATTSTPVSVAIEDIIEEEHYIGSPGGIGFGVSAIPDSMLPPGWTKRPGHNDKNSDNYGNVIDPNGSVMVWIPRFYFKWNSDNTLNISAYPLDGYVVHRAFIDGGSVKHGFFIDKYQCSNVNGVFASQQGLDPCSTSSQHNPIGNLTGAPVNNYGGLYTAVSLRGLGYNLTALYQYNALALLSFAQGRATTSVAECAFVDVLPHMPKGCNNNALHDSSDNSVEYTSSGYSNCGLTGSGVPFAKTTHNGQICGVADINGNMWEVASGFIKMNDSDAAFKALKQSVSLSNITNDSTTQGSGGAYDIDLYDDLDLTGIVADAVSSRYGNSTETVFEMNTDISSDAYKRTSLGIPLATGKSGGGSTEFGNDYLYEKWRNQLACIVGGYWDSVSNAGAFALHLYGARTTSGNIVGGRASYFV